MNDAEFSFYEDVRRGKRMAASSHHRVVGSKSKKCTLASDYLTQAQIQKLHGDTEVYRMKEPMKWNEFIAMPLDLQEKYLSLLVDTYEVRTPQLAEMFGKSRTHVLHYLTKNLPSVKIFPRGTKISKSKLDEWHKFVNSNNVDVSSSKSASKILDKTGVELVDTRGIQLVDTGNNFKDTKQPITISHLNIGYDGLIDIDEVVAYLQLVLGNKFEGHLEISFSKGE